MIDIHIGARPQQTGVPWDTVNTLGPHLLWLLFAIGLLCWIGRSRLDAILMRVVKLKVAGVEVELGRTLQQAAEARGEQIPAADLGRAARRLASSTALLAGARLLWIDDQPRNNRFERALFEEAGASVEEAVSSEQAWRFLDTATYDLILSDIRRGDDVRAGMEFLERFIDRRRNIPVVFYVGRVCGAVPEGAFGITDSPDELVHLVLDALARKRS